MIFYSNPSRLIKAILLVFACQFIIFTHKAEAQENDSLMNVDFSEIILMSPDNGFHYQDQPNPIGSIDEYLSSGKQINMIKRGAYAWEPTLNNMSTQRLNMTIDGMHIFQACTDKMDPITSYVSTNNLKKARIQSGQQGAVTGNAIGGSVDLEVDKSDFNSTGLTGSLQTGYETNNKLRVFSEKLKYSDSLWYIDGTASYRKADNYKAGHGHEIEFSQFQKNNFSLNAGYKLSDTRALHGSFIYDEATDVGYPALPMDASLARGIIGSLTYNQDRLWNALTDWETKLYFNVIKHVMDDSKRPDVVMHMDMPGWSNTYGLYSQARLQHKKHHFFFKLDGYLNRSYARMTMKGDGHDDGDMPGMDDMSGMSAMNDMPEMDDMAGMDDMPMHMVTWPDLHTLNTGVYASDKILFGASFLKLSTRLALQNDAVMDRHGLEELRAIYPNVAKSKTRFLKSFSARYHQHFHPFSVDLGVSYGDRAPSVTEGYGYYIFNSFDNYDYIGDPNLKNEKSLEADLSFRFKTYPVDFEIGANYFHIYDYIIGKFDENRMAMTHGADGVKRYENLTYADIFNLYLSGEVTLTDGLTWNGKVSYNVGEDDADRHLPLISPFTYRTGLKYNNRGYSASVHVKGAAKQQRYAPFYGETKTPAYTVMSASVGKRFRLKHMNALMIKVGMDNIFDRDYTTYTDWNNIPRMGRNLFVSMGFSFR